MLISEHAARALLDGFQSGELDELDIVSIFQDPDAWIDESESYAATEARHRLSAT